MNTHPDCHYIEGLLKNDSRKIDELYKNYFPLAMKIIASTNGTRNDAHDIFQEAIVALLEKAIIEGACFLEKASLKTYIFVLCRNHWTKYLRTRKKIISQDVIKDELVVLMSINETELNTVANEIENYEMQKSIQKALESMDTTCRQLLEQYAEGKKHKEIGDFLNIKINEVGTYIQRCLKKVRLLLPITQS